MYKYCVVLLAALGSSGVSPAWGGGPGTTANVYSLSIPMATLGTPLNGTPQPLSTDRNPLQTPRPNGTYPYDGGPKNAVPNPQETTPPTGAPQRTVPLEGRTVSLPKPAAKWAYPAYGETARRTSSRRDQSVLARAGSKKAADRGTPVETSSAERIGAPEEQANAPAPATIVVLPLPPEGQAMRRWIPRGAVMAALGSGVAASAWLPPPPCLPPLAGFEERTVTFYRPEYRTEYREVQRVVCRDVPETREQEVQETVMVPHWREEQRQETVLVPHVRHEQRQRTVVCTEWREEQRQRTVRVPVVREVEEKYTVRVPEWREEQRQETVMVPEVRVEKRQQAVTVMRQVPEVRTREAVTWVQLLVAVRDRCTGVVSHYCEKVPQIRQIQEVVTRCLPELEVRESTVQVPFLRPQTRTVKVRVPSYREEVRTRRVPVTTYEERTETYTARVPVRREEVETYTVPVCEMRPETRSYTARVKEYRAEVRKRTVQVTTWKTVREVVTEKVPFTTCVPVPYEVTVCVPVCDDF